jgi:ubiquinone/menaquinone biosynthesis C-methylase UbiE
MFHTSNKQTFSDTFQQLEQMYAKSLRTHGDTPQATQQADILSQEQRMRLLCQVADLRKAKILDFGCGTGHLLDFMRRECGFIGQYVGYDITQAMIDQASAKHKDARFERRNILESGIPEDFDAVLVTGTFNNFTGDNWTWMTSCLRVLWNHTRMALAFNNLSTYVDFFAEGLYYESPGRVFNFCKEHLSPLVTVRHDYCVRPGVVPYEFTTYVYRTTLAVRRDNTNFTSRR